MVKFDINIWYIIVPLCFMLLDCVSGFIRSVLKKELSSTKAREGLMHKLGFILAIAVGIFLQCASQVIDLGFEIPSMAAICVYIVLVECMSIVENIGDMNPDIANSNIFQFFKKDSE